MGGKQKSSTRRKLPRSSRSWGKPGSFCQLRCLCPRRLGDLIEPGESTQSKSGQPCGGSMQAEQFQHCKPGSHGLEGGHSSTPRHPELGSGSRPAQATEPLVEGWMLNQVQHDGNGGGGMAAMGSLAAMTLSLIPALCRNPPGGELQAKGSIAPFAPPWIPAQGREDDLVAMATIVASLRAAIFVVLYRRTPFRPSPAQPARFP